MKKHSSIFICLASFFLTMLFSVQIAYTQSSIIGSWEGIFMNDFKVLVDFSSNDQNMVEGNIKLFSGENMIQDDKIIHINLSNDKFSFYIPDKETNFEGALNDEFTDLSGVFIFPDGSRHDIYLNKKLENTNTFEAFKKLKSKQFSAREIFADLAFLHSSLKENHPQLFAYTSESSMDELIEILRSKVDTTSSLEEFYLITAKLTEAIHCSHTGVRLPKIYGSSINKFGHYFPLKLFFLNDQAFYLTGYQEKDEAILPGDEILSINNLPVQEIIEQIFYIIPSEGYNTSTKYHELNRRFNELFYFLSDAEHFDITFKAGDKIKRVTVSSKSLDDIDLEPKTIDSKKRMDFNYVNDMATGIFKVPTFAIPDMDDYLYQLEQVFNDLRAANVQNLVLDLRDNHGGHPIFAAQLLSYLTNKDFVYFKKNDAVKEFEPLYHQIQPNALNYQGNIFVLVNGGCLSTTGHLISLLKYHTNAIFIGEEPGSTFRCNDFSIQLTLPNTGIELNVPRTTFETAVTGFTLNKPFPIDYRINSTIIDIIDHKDPFIEKVKSLING